MTRSRLYSLLVLAALVAPSPRVLEAADASAIAEAPKIVRLDAGDAVRVSTAALLISGMSGGDLEVSALAVALPSAATEGRVLVLLEVEPATLPPQAEVLDLEVAVYAFNNEGEVAAASAVEIHLDSPDVGGLQITTALSLATGSYTLRAAVLERGSGAVGLTRRSFEVPAPGPNAWVAWFLQPGTGWIVGVADPVALEALRSGSKIAATRPALERNEIAWLSLSQPSATQASPSIEARLLTDDGEVVATVPLTLAPGLTTDSGTRTHEASFRLPDLPPDAYHLRIAPAGRPESLAFTALPFVVRPAPDGHMVAPEDPEDPSQSDAGTAGYRAVLQTLAVGDLSAAVSDLRSLERDVHRQAGAGGLQRFMRSEQTLIEAIGREAPSALVALVPLHAQLIEEYHVTSGDALVEMYTAATLELLTRLMARRTETPGDRRAAAGAASGAGASLQRTDWREASDRVFQSAIALDGANHAALLGAAAGREKAGDHRSAVALLSTLTSAHPGAEEPRLRLALNLVRAGETVRGTESLRALSQEARTEWISILAFQELARREETADRAAEILHRGLARWPDEPGLLLQLALVRESKDSATASAGLLAPLLRMSVTGQAPRVRYNEWPDPPVGDLGEARARQALAGWLEAGTGAR